MTAGTDFSASVAWVAEKLGLPGIPYEAALNASDKDRMRRCFAAAEVPSPGFVVFAAEDAVQSLPFGFPVVVKPVDNMGARGCRRVDSAGELGAALGEARRFSRSGRAIVEEFMEGPEFSVDALVFKDDIQVCGFADRHIFFPPYFIEMGHTMPSTLGEAETQPVLEVFFAGIRALGITAGCGAAKGDLKLTPRGPMIGEIAARLSGGYMSGWTYPYASGVELTRGAILAALGRPWAPRPSRAWTSAERALISIPGKVRSIHGLEQARSTEHVKNVFLRVAEGSAVRFPENNVSKCGNTISAAPDRAAAVAAAEKAAAALLIRLEAGREETDEFLESGDGAFPPSAYTLSPELRLLLDRLPERPLPEVPPDGSGLSRAVLCPFPEFVESALTDFVGRSPGESLEAIRVITALPLPIMDMDTEKASPVLGRPFWRSLIRGGYQGAVYYLDTLRLNTKRGPAIP
jgi:biotin carboxylase